MTLIPPSPQNYPNFPAWHYPLATSQTQNGVISEAQARNYGTPGEHTFDLKALGNACVFRSLFQTVQEVASDYNEHWELGGARDMAGLGRVITLHKQTDARTG